MGAMLPSSGACARPPPATARMLPKTGAWHPVESGPATIRAWKTRSSGHLVGVIARADERAAGHVEEPERAGQPAQFGELLGGDVAGHGQVPRRGPQVLA